MYLVTYTGTRARYYTRINDGARYASLTRRIIRSQVPYMCATHFVSIYNYTGLHSDVYMRTSINGQNCSIQLIDVSFSSPYRYSNWSLSACARSGKLGLISLQLP